MPPEVEPDDNSISGAADAPEPREPTLREIAEAAYDEGSEDTGEPVANRGDGRDARGRFASKEQMQEEGEAEAEPPSPEKKTEAPVQPEPAPPGSSTQPIEHWSAEDRAIFAKLPKDAQDFFLRRYGEMEADYTRKSQANAGAVQVVNALAPIFNDPDIAASMQENNFQHPVQAIMDWARLHKGAVSSNPQDRASVLIEIAERMGFDPAKTFAANRQPEVEIPEHLRANPVVKYLTDQVGRSNSDLQALRAELNSFRATESQKAEEAVLRTTRASIDHYADEKGADGRVLRPFFDRVLPVMIEMFKVNPERDLNEAYDTACWADPTVRKDMLQMEMSRAQQRQSNQRAQQAAKSNVRGLTSPVSKPSPDKKGNGSLRDTLEASADEVGF